MNQMTPFGHERDRFFMSQALAQAKKASQMNEVPVGAVLVNADGEIVARAYNAVEKKHSQSAHAEMLVLKKGSGKIKNWRLEGYWLYVTLQPCIMCMGFIRLSRINGVVYAAPSPLFGFDVDFEIPSQVYKSKMLILGGILQEEAAVLLREFFQRKRKEHGNEQNKKRA